MFLGAPLFAPDARAGHPPAAFRGTFPGSGRLPTRAVSTPVEGGPGDIGRWLAPQAWPVIAIHAATLTTGEVLHYSYPSGGPGSNARLWDPVGDVFTDVTMSTDIFCSGLSQLPDGRLYVTGGNDYSCDFQGRLDTHAFDPWTRLWTRLEDMTVGRWYPTNVALGDGRTLILSGLDRSCETTPVMEMLVPGEGLSVVPEGERLVELYPHLYLLPSGQVAHVGPERATFTWDPAALVWQFVADMGFGSRYDGTSAPVPGSPWEILTCGGSGAAATESCERIDFSQPAPAWRFTGAMSFARAHGNLVVLPDRRVLMVGGGLTNLYEDPILNAEIYDPASEAWTLLPAQVHGRMYHSTAVLLPDGRVLSAGQDDGPGAFTAEIYEPSYLFQGPRPQIAAAPARIAYGRAFSVTTPQAAEIGSVSLLALSTVTHSVNNGQRYVGLGFAQTGGSQLAVTPPPGGDWAPPGPYMLFLVDDSGVPSVSALVSLELAEVFADGFESGDTSAWSGSVP